MKDIIAFVPARGGSSRVPRKNLKPIGGLPLFLRACYNLHQVLPKDRIIVDSDDQEMLELAEQNGFKTLVRPSELSTNATDGNAFFRWETGNFPSADVYIQHLPPMAFLSKITLERALNAIDEGYDSIVCVGKEHYYLWDIEKNIPLYDLEHIPNSFTLKDTVFETMGLYVITGNAHKKSGLRIGPNFKMIDIPKIEQVDIDYPDDFDLAAAIENGLPATSPYKSAVLCNREK